MKIKMTYPFLFFVFCAISGYSQKGDCSYSEYFRGVVLVSEPYYKKENKSGSEITIPIDKPRRMLFIPFEEDSSLNISKYLKDGFEDFFFTFPPFQWEDAFFQCSDTSTIKNLITKLSISDQLNESTTYYKLRGLKDQGIYSIYFLEGEWLKMEYDPWENKLSSNFKVELINPDVRKIDLYYLLKSISLFECTSFKNKAVKKLK